jgi:hypothetical protein
VRKPRKKHLRIRISDSESLRVCSEETGINGIYHRRSSDHSAAEVATVEALYRVLASLHLVKLEINVSFGVGLDGDVDDVAIFVLRFLANILLEFLDPVVSLLPAIQLANISPTPQRLIIIMMMKTRGLTYSSGSNML